MKDKVLAIYGAGGLATEVYLLAQQINEKQKRWKKYVFIEDDLSKKALKGNPVVDFETIKNSYDRNSLECVIAIGEPQTRKEIFKRLINDNFNLTTLIHPNVYINENIEIGKGSIVNANCLLTCDIKIGENVYIQPNAILGHGSIIDDNCLISSGVIIAGNCHIHERTYIGLNVPIKENTNIGCDVIVGMGSVVFNDLSDNVIALGNPARPMKKNNEKKVFK